MAVISNLLSSGDSPGLPAQPRGLPDPLQLSAGFYPDGGHCCHLHLQGWERPQGGLAESAGCTAQLRRASWLLPRTVFPAGGTRTPSPWTHRQGTWVGARDTVGLLGGCPGKASKRGSCGHLSQVVAPGTLSTRKTKFIECQLHTCLHEGWH